ncbi:MAG: hypothetical protein H0V09_10025 [Gemmatimonadetes bacterium]|nr:hypothetical protein [Gemmatimonadota bacterium]
MTSREQRTVRWGAAGAGLILAYVLLVDPYLVRAAESRTLMEEREAQLARLGALERSLPVFRRELAAAQGVWDRDVRPRLLPAEIPTIAATGISELVRRLAAQSFLEVERENVLSPGQEGGLTSVPVQFSLRGDIYGLRDFLAALQTSDVFLHLRELRVNTVTAGFAIAGAGDATLQITLTLEGYLREVGDAGGDNNAAGAQPPLEGGTLPREEAGSSLDAAGDGDPEQDPGNAFPDNVEGDVEPDDVPSDDYELEDGGNEGFDGERLNDDGALEDAQDPLEGRGGELDDMNQGRP